MYKLVISLLTVIGMMHGSAALSYSSVQLTRAPYIDRVHCFIALIRSFQLIISPRQIIERTAVVTATHLMAGNGSEDDQYYIHKSINAAIGFIQSFSINA